MGKSVVVGLPGLSVDLDRLTEKLRGTGAPVGQILELQSLAGGISNLTLLVRGQGGECVVRRRPFGSIPARAHDMHHEFRILTALSKFDLPIPRVFAYFDDEDTLDAPFYAMELVRGIVAQDRSDAEALSNKRRALVSEDLVRVLAELHAVPLASIETYQPGRGLNFVRRQIHRWQERWQARPHRDLPVVDELAEALRSLVPSDEEVTLVHGDYRLGNTILDRSAPGRPVKAVLDWELSTFGNPLTDLAHLIAFWEPTGEHYSHRAQHIAEAPGFLSGAELANHYSAISGRAVHDLQFYLAYEHWRAVIIKEGVYQRQLEVGAPPAEAAGTKVGVDGHIREAVARLTLVDGHR